MIRLKKIIDKIRETICTSIFVLDSLFLIGIFVLIGTNFIVNPIFGLYSIAFFLIGFSIYISRTKMK